MQTWFIRFVLMFVVFCVTTLTAIIAARFLMPALGHDFNLDLARKVGWALSPLSIFLYIRTWKKSDFQRTAAPPPLPKAKTNLVQKLGWAVAIAVGGWFILSVAKSSLKDAQLVKQPGSNAFHQANLLIMGSRNGIEHGNTPEAKMLAGELSARLKVARKQGIEARKSAAFVSLTGGEFLTYCHLTEESCVFLVHVPDLRKFSVGAKEFIADAALSTALSVAAKSNIPPRTVAVGIRGVLAYESARSASLGEGTNVAYRQPSAVKGDDESKAFLVSYFNPPAPAKIATQAVATPQNVSTRIGASAEK